MKKLTTFALASVLAVPLFAAEVLEDDSVEDIELPPPETESVSRDHAAWPVVFAFCEIPDTPDIVGLRLTIPFSTKQESVTGIDLGLWGSCRYFEGLQLNLVRNKVADSMGGVQLGCYNSVNRGDFFGLQVGLWNEANCLRGVQVGLFNVMGDGVGFQFGLINRAEDLHGYQVGLVNVIRAAEISVLPVLNIGF